MRKLELEKIVVNTSFGRLSASAPDFENKLLPEIKQAVANLTGQLPQLRSAKKSIAGFKVREGMPVGLKVTLRRKKMNQFLDKVINIVLPRVRDFRGIKLTSIDSSGNLTFGVKEHIVFPEIVLEDVNTNFGLEVTLTLRESAHNKEEAIEFYKKLGVPFVKEEK
ncbi:MAG: 50S ribosomal protein L5 [Candidatus Harrisonbacteria bacterium CG10_big_fil_rev_8_21_14_0_10_38_8]|uniref:Large ribosomal subunit protein uL5 n=1 Tax=Candidatus Harrisonbacteria bacterium CG10_big_fil_rev_8_21_14_0_10_38_8 TaxID=1974582 RepID=A0A2M6WK66_9BACT|nr:MAG: 50S ribosomal protein L5 [Candidatus Harrisonbacteria bacterium CG10_big_fil_rev_8_21_14_0_10_38_8]